MNAPLQNSNQMTSDESLPAGRLYPVAFGRNAPFLFCCPLPSASTSDGSSVEASLLQPRAFRKRIAT